jgi:hypothetical protein
MVWATEERAGTSYGCDNLRAISINAEYSEAAQATISNAMAKFFSVAGGVFLGALIVSTSLADGDMSAQRLLASWKDEDPGMRMVAEVIASAFASGFSWGGDATGKRVYCSAPGLKGGQIMGAFEAFVRDNPALAERPYGEAMSGTLRKAFPCGQGT